MYVLPPLFPPFPHLSLFFVSFFFLEKDLWTNFTKWLESNGVTNYNVTLAYFEGSGRGLAVTKDMEVPSCFLYL